MKKVLLFVIFLSLTAFSVLADEQKRVKLDDNHTKEQVRLAFCNIFVTRTEVDDDENVKVIVEIENLDESNVIILFGHAYPEKELKKLSPSIRFDKGYPGTKGQRNIDTYSKAGNAIFVEPSEKSVLPQIQVKGNVAQLCRFPLYIAKYNNRTRSKMLLLEKQVIEVEIEVQVKPDEDFIRLEQMCNDLIEDISKQTFCTNSRHLPSLERQEEPYKVRVGQIKKEIDEIIGHHNWYTRDKSYQRYDHLKQKLDSIQFADYERDCGIANKHRSARRHSCKYCNLSLQQIFHKLDDYYKKIYNSTNRKATKETVIQDVNILYRCCTDANCPKHSSLWNKSQYKSKITDRYTRISNF
ncbi:MAG: hypothetical protein J6Z14_11755 [Prevotella sp.]|nr:hypothetical protein [Prevotella sp.]